MTCSNTIVEYNLKRNCWLPLSSTSPFEMCSRCTFHRIEEELKKIQTEEGDLTLLQRKTFLTPSFEDGHQRTLLDALAKVNETRKDLVEEILQESKGTVFHRFLNTSLTHHTTSYRCSLYRVVLQKNDKKEAYQTELPWKCYGCLTWVLKQKKLCGLYDAFIRGLLNNRLKEGSQHPKEIILMMTSLHIHHKKIHNARLLFDIVRRTSSQEQAEHILIEFLKQPYFTDEQRMDYIPVTWNQLEFLATVEREILPYIKKRNWVFKEELMMKTWHPDRFLLWCLDLEEMNDFLPS